jgi:Triose-phosphate Transporter family
MMRSSTTSNPIGATTRRPPSLAITPSKDEPLTGPNHHPDFDQEEEELELDGTPLPATTASLYWGTALTTLAIVFWYGISTTIILSTKWLFNQYFSHPLTVTALNNCIAALWALLVSKCFPHLKQPDQLSKDLLYNYVLTIGLTTALEIGASNVALQLLSVSFGTILKGGGPIFTFLWGLFFRIEVFSWKIGGVLLAIALGIILASLGEGQEFQWLGFLLQLSASALGGLRWAITHKLLKNSTHTPTPSSTTNEHRLHHHQHSSSSFHDNDTFDNNNVNSNKRNGETDHGRNDSRNHRRSNNNPPPLPITRSKPMSPLSAILYTSPMTSLCVLPFALVLEGPSVWKGFHQNSDDGNNAEHNDLFLVGAVMTGIATLVFLLLMTEYWLVNATSSLALSVAGVFKELLTIGGAIFFLSDSMDLLNVIGFIICQIGIFSYVSMRFDKTKVSALSSPTSTLSPKGYHPVTTPGMESQSLASSASVMEAFVDEEVELTMYNDAFHVNNDDDDDDDDRLEKTGID